MDDGGWEESDLFLFLEILFRIFYSDACPPRKFVNSEPENQ
jgi:hypothetical protein